MAQLPALITDLALILGAAAAITIFFRKVKLPIVLGYILAGLLVGPNLHLFPALTDQEGIKIWAEIGVVFLLFSLGLEFSFKKLMKVGGAAAITGIFEVSLLFTAGFLLGRYLHWSSMDSLFLGGILSISSTTIIIRTFDELGLRAKQFTTLVLGVLVIEDLVAVLLLAFLSTVALHQKLGGAEWLFSIFKLAFFLCLWFILGIFLLPTLLNKINRLLSRETLLLLSIGLCLGMVVLANQVGFSPALGAFLMGSMLAETSQGPKIEQVVSSIRDLFGAIFFVSVGMLINPDILVRYARPVLLLTATVVVGKLLFVSIGALFSGRPLKQAVQAGASMTQIGEFSFIIATLGITMKATNEHLYPIAVGVSVLTIFLSPFLIRLSEPLFQLIQVSLPKAWLDGLDQYSSSSQQIEGERGWRVLLRYYFQHVLLNSVVIIALILLVSFFLNPFLYQFLQNEIVASSLSAGLGLLSMAPFIWALTGKKLHRTAYVELWLDRKYNHGPLVMLELMRNGVAVLLVGILFRQLFSIWVSIGGTIFVLFVIGLLFKRGLQRFYQRMEDRFLENLQDQEPVENHTSKERLSPWDAHLTQYEINTAVDFLGKSLEDLQWREKYGINIAYIERGDQLIYAPARTAQLFPFDKIGVIGTDLQLHAFGTMLEPSPVRIATDKAMIVLEKLIVDEINQLKGKTIRGSGIREMTDGLVVGIERSGVRILNPTSDTVFAWDDVVWIVGNKKKIRRVSQGGSE